MHRNLYPDEMRTRDPHSRGLSGYELARPHMAALWGFVLGSVPVKKSPISIHF